MTNNPSANKQNGGFLKLPRNLMSQAEIAKLIDKEGASGLALYISINLYLAHCQDNWGAYTGRQFSSLATELKKNRSDVRRVIDNYGLFIVDGEHFTSHWMQQQWGKKSVKTVSSRAYLYTHAEDIDKEEEKENKEKGIVRVSDDTHMPSGENASLPPAPSQDATDDMTTNYLDYNNYLKR